MGIGTLHEFYSTLDYLLSKPIRLDRVVLAAWRILRWFICARIIAPAIFMQVSRDRDGRPARRLRINSNEPSSPVLIVASSDVILALMIWCF